MRQNQPAPLTNYKVQQMIQRVIKEIPLKEQAKITDTKRLNQLFLDRQKAILNQQFFKAQIIERQFSSEQEIVLAQYALKKMSEDHKYYKYVEQNGLKSKFYPKLGWKLRSKHRTKEECIESARKYKTYKEWCENEQTIRAYANNKGWIGDIANLFPDYRRRIDTYTKDECRTIALQYDSPKKLRLENLGVWTAIKRNNWILELCGHMPAKMLLQYVPDVSFSELVNNKQI